ncbi:autotransporter domain-containing protein [Nisaea denitrificans]|uniref:autotransporter domain-containing protein n=1 Tax=Nisaea denitrificans TaxID=390877 RepID=UPI000426DA37|nr:autotransporter domain-containing protein [Nisaea denitrificans]
MAQKTSRARFAATICSATLCFAAAASADDRYIFLGDSLVDNQNSFIATGLITPTNVIPRTPPYYQGRFSNGPNWTDRLAPTQLYYMDYYFSNPDCATTNASNGLASLCGSTTNPGAQDGVSLSFAFGGAKAGTEDLPSAAPGLLSVFDDLTAYNTSGVVANTSGATFAILTGGNDYTNYVIGANPGVSEQGIVDQTLGNIQTGIERASTLGARRVIVLNLFDLDRVPTLVTDFTADQLAQSGRLSASHNAGMPTMLQTARTNTGLEIVLVDLDALYDDIDAQPSLYGFTNTTGSCITNNVANGQCPDAASENATLYWDGQHPTTAAHGYIAELVTATLQAVDSDGGRLAALADSGLEQQRAVMSALRGQIHDLRRGPGLAGSGTAPVSSQQFGDSTVFIIAENGFGSRDRDGDFSGYDYDSRMAMVGISYRPDDSSRDFIVGAHIGYANLDSSINGGGSFDNDAVTFGGFGGWRSGAFSLGLQAGLSYHTVDDVKRDTGFSVMPTARSDTSGWGANAELEARWDNDLKIGERRIGYAASGRLGAGWTTLDGFTETGASFLNLTVDDSDVAEVKAGVDFTVWTDVDMTNGVLQPYLGVGYEHDLLDAEREIDARLSSGQIIHADSRAGAQNLFNLAGGLRYLASNGLRAELKVAASLGAGGEESFILPQLRIAKSF